jgi:hypothetical protein
MKCLCIGASAAASPTLLPAGLPAASGFGAASLLPLCTARFLAGCSGAIGWSRLLRR